MRLFGGLCALLLLAVGLSVVPVSVSEAGCTKILGTADGWGKPDAVAGAQAALASAISEFRAKRGAVSVSPSRPKPQPYWRSAVTSDLYFKPDVVTAKSHTVCWRGVVSPVVCTAGAAVCW
jgi:hypothetical protein